MSPTKNRGPMVDQIGTSSHIKWHQNGVDGKWVFPKDFQIHEFSLNSWLIYSCPATP
jgi:hypothetical protein